MRNHLGSSRRKRKMKFIFELYFKATRRFERIKIGSNKSNDDDNDGF